MNFGEEMKWQNQRDIRDWCEKNGFENVVKRMELNNDCWNSSGEFGRNQVEICDSLRYADSEEDALMIAETIDKETSENYGLW